MQNYHTSADRAAGALWGLALGDALGMPTQSFSPAQIAQYYGKITELTAAAAAQPIAPAMPAGSVTDDTEQALLLAQHLVEQRGVIDPHLFAKELLAWEAVMIARGSADLLGPSTKAALQALNAGVSYTETGKRGATNGAAMRIAPVGIAYEPGQALTDAVLRASIATHNTQIGLAAACAVAHTISAAINGLSVPKALNVGLTAANTIAATAPWTAGASIAHKYATCVDIALSLSETELTAFLQTVVGTSVAAQESVVAALLLARYYADNPQQGLLVAANLGGDTDTIAAIAGAIFGAAFGQDLLTTQQSSLLRQTNTAVPQLAQIPALATALLELRKRNHNA